MNERKRKKGRECVCLEERERKRKDRKRAKKERKRAKERSKRERVNK